MVVKSQVLRVTDAPAASLEEKTDGVTVGKVSEFRFLGFILGKKLSWKLNKSYIKIIVAKIVFVLTNIIYPFLC